MRKAYYSHPKVSYNTPLESADIETIQRLGFKVINPNTDKHQKTSGGKMDYFVELVKECDVLIFRAFADDYAIGAGVAKEIQTAQVNHIPVIELPNFYSHRSLNINETRARRRL